MQKQTWSGRRTSWAQSQGTWLSRIIWDWQACLRTGPVTFDLFDPWTLWWFLDGEDYSRGAKLLQQIWQTRRRALEMGVEYNVLSPSTSNCHCNRWDQRWFRNCAYGFAAPVQEVHLSTHTICSLVYQCHQAWRRASQEEREIGTEMGRQLMAELSLQRFTACLSSNGAI